MKGTLAISWGKYGGFYFKRGSMIRICLGWLAITYIPMEIDDLLKIALSKK
jgi:hypothetical protein